MTRGDLLVTAAIVSWAAWLATLVTFLFLNDDRILARAVFGTNVPAWRATMDILAAALMVLGLLGLVFAIALTEAKPDV